MGHQSVGGLHAPASTVSESVGHHSVGGLHEIIDIGGAELIQTETVPGVIFAMIRPRLAVVMGGKWKY